jgi:hypothetical protein
LCAPLFARQLSPRNIRNAYRRLCVAQPTPPTHSHRTARTHQDAPQEELRQFTLDSWEKLLRYMVDRTGNAAVSVIELYAARAQHTATRGLGPSQAGSWALHALYGTEWYRRLVKAELMAKDTRGGVSITNSGFQFLLWDR